MPQDKLKQKLRTYLFGYPLHNSLAPLLHATVFQSLDVPWTYELVESTEKTAFLPKLKADDCVGAAITMPHKVSWMSECDDITEEGAAIGAINTVFIRQDPDTGRKCYVGTNTDCVGVREAFLQNVPGILPRCEGRPALVVGGGGACRSAVYALHRWLGASEIYLVNRDREEVDAVMASLAATPSPPKLTHVATVEQARRLDGPVLVVGTVPDAPPATEGEVLAREITAEFLKKERKGVVLEMCYHPRVVTEFYSLAEGYGWKVLPGTESMIHQGMAQEVLWMERPLRDMPVEAAKAVVAEALSKRSV